jgi:NAD(P)-dependent dehydrogenase (short-subunit alcohol dehydrogenase family)
MRALITGGAKRLGREMSLYLAKRGYDVAVHYNSSDDDARVVVDEIHAMGRRATQLQANILDESQVETLVSRAASALDGPITVLVNNASIFEYDNIKSATRTSLGTPHRKQPSCAIRFDAKICRSNSGPKFGR